MLERSGFIYKIVSIGVAILCLLSCAPQPELEWVPKIKSQSATVTDNVCVLMAEASTDLADGYSCGFFYGKTEDNMHRVKAKADGKNFEYTLYSLDHETEYLYKAYVSNGRNEICSDIRYFRTLKEKEPPSANPDNLPEFLKEVPYCASTFGTSLPEGLLGDIRFVADGSQNAKWIRWNRSDEAGNTRLDFYVDENSSDEERFCNLIIAYGGKENFITVMQKYAGGIIAFEDPLVKKACVDAFDLDADGELSYYEASMPDNIDNLNFYLMDISSFDEFQWFTNVKEINSSVFTESGIESIEFPFSFRTLADYVFYCCRKLVDIDLTDIVVNSTFSGCASLENVKAKIAGYAAFSDCPGLKTVVQQLSGVPDCTFINCEYLHSFDFDITETGVHYIGRRAFEGCPRLRKITIPEDITEIRDDAFRYCLSLVGVYMEPVDPPVLGEGVFAGTNEDLKIYVPMESLSRYQEAWAELPVTIEPNDPESILMILPLNSHDFNYSGGLITFYLMGDAPFEIEIPSEVDWLEISCTGRKCSLTASTNNSFDERRCELVFKNLSTGDCEIFSVRQSGAPSEETNLPFDKIYASYEERIYSFSLPRDKYEHCRSMPEYDWLSCSHGSQGNSAHISIRVSENTTNEDRTGRVLIDYDGRTNIFTVIQKAYGSIIEFKDPVVKEACVSAFDQDGDGQLACWEAAAVTGNGLDILDFSGMEITSFDELCWFTNLVEINMPIFAGSHLESVVLPFDIIMRGGVFENCTELKTVGLNCCNVADGVFKGCSGLKNVDVKYVGTSSFEDCTGLETVALRSALVSPSAFRNCTSLRLFEFSGEGGGSCYICEEAFAGCTSLPEITVISKITQIHDRAFYGCSSLSAVYIRPSEPPALGNDVFALTHPSLKIYVPRESVGLYKEAWPSLAERIVSEDWEDDQSRDYIDEYGINHGQGVEIDGVVWAPVNCGYHAIDYQWGKLYQWGRKYGQGYVGDVFGGDGYYVGTSVDASEPEIVMGPVSLHEGESESNADKFYCVPRGSINNWCSLYVDWLWNSGTEIYQIKTEYDPCPDGWRVPTHSELERLNDNHSSWTTDEKGQTGYWFSGTSPYAEKVPQVFFPAAGCRSGGDGVAVVRGCNGFYWTSRSYSDELSYLIHFGMDHIDDMHATGCLSGYSVRCVQE